MDARRALAVLGGGPLAFAAGWRQPLRRAVPMHAHDGFELVLHVSGRGLTRTALGEALAFAANQLVLYPPRLAHDQVAYGDGEEWCVQALPSGRVARVVDACRVVDVAGDEYVRAEMAALTRIAPDAAAHDALGLRATALVAHALTRAGAPARERDPVEAAETVLRERSRDLRRLDEVAQAVGLSLDRLRHVFRERTGRSLSQRLAELRLERAAHLLARAPLRLEDVARECGFYDGRHLARAFRRAHGVSPGAWRRGARE